MFTRVQRAFAFGRDRLLRPASTRHSAVYQQWTPTSSAESRALTDNATKSEITVDTKATKSDVSSDVEYHLQSPDSSVSSFVSPKRTLVQKIFGEQFTGWRFGALHFAAWAVVVFLINLIITIWGSTARDQGILMEGDCHRVEFWNNGLHVVINILSTILLSGSNYCMQCLSAPTRGEVDRAHANKRWLDIGIPSIRNVKHLGKQRIALWVVLALTSLPLHLFYNSAVYGSLSSNDYFAFAVSESFLTDEECRNCSASVNNGMSAYRRLVEGYQNYPFYSTYSTTPIPWLLETLHTESKAGLLDRLEPKDCLEQYALSVQSNRRSLLVVASDDNFPPPAENKFINGSHIHWAGPFFASDANNGQDASNAYNWICSGMNLDGAYSNDVDLARQNISSWRVGYDCQDKLEICKVGTFPVQYCLAQPAEPHCRLQFDTTIAIIVTLLNFAKTVLMFYIAYCVPEEPLITMGDAVASFLEHPDPTTQDMCLLSIHDVRKGGYSAGPREWTGQRYRWKDIASKKRLATTLALFLAALGIVSFLLALGITSLPPSTPRSFSSLIRLGYGRVDPTTAITGLSNDMISNAIIANSPQVILSCLYFSYNALFTSFLLSHEWLSYAHKKKGLRVSWRPRGAQRTEYFLQLPYKFSLPLLTLSGTLHWLVSQAIFLVSIDFYDVLGSPASNYFVGSGNMKTCGYSPIAIITVLIFGVCMVLAGGGFGLVKYKKGMPLAGSSSWAISAACHGEEDGMEVARGKVRWGIVGEREGVRHCGFSRGRVKRVERGEMYM